MEDGTTLEELLALGDREIASGETDLALHYYNQALKKNTADPRLNFRLTEAYRLKAGSGGAVFYTLAMEPLRRILKADPINETAHEKLLLLAFKAGALGDLAREYRARAKAGTAEELYAKYLKRAQVLSLLDNDVRIRVPEYRPVGFIKAFFDFIILPAGIMGMVFSSFGNEFKPLFIMGITFFLFYCAYRAILCLMMRRQ